ncbi:hypothetical protein MMC27_008084 [Xylographa pallens]|nr:hypothetical protein [Xylographa pallens]
MFNLEEEAASLVTISKKTTSYSLALTASMDPAQSSVVLPKRQSGPETHGLAINNSSLYMLADPETTYIMDEQSGFPICGIDDSANLSPSHGTSSSDRHPYQVTTDVYVCTKDGCVQQFTSLSEIQEHKDERHQSSTIPMTCHSFYVLHSTLSRHGFYKSAMRFWCRLCRTEKGFWSSHMLRDHARKQHPWVLLPEQVDCLPEVAIRCPASTVIVPSESIPDVAIARRSSSRDTIENDLAGTERSAGGEGIHKSKKRGKNGQPDWEAHRDVLSELYMTQDYSLGRVMEHMSRIYNFHVKMRAYKERFKLWGFDKNVPARDMGVIVALVEKRKREDGKDSLIFFKGRSIKTIKMERYKRRKMVPGAIEDITALPNHIRCETPPLGSSPSDDRKNDDCSSHIPASASRLYSVKSLADATFNDYWALNESSKVRVPGESGSQTFNDHARTLLSQASDQEIGDDHEGAERLYRGVLDLPETEKDTTSVFDALRGIIRIHAKVERLETVIPELERLVAGCLCLFGPEHETYISLALGLAVKYYILGQPMEGNILIGRLLATYETSSSGNVQEDSCAFLLTRASRWNPEVVATRSFNAVYWRLIDQYKRVENWEDPVTLTLDIVELLQDPSSQERVLAKTTESYLRRAYGLYTGQEKHGRYAHSHKLLNCTVVQLNQSRQAWMDRVLVLFNVLQNDLTAQYFSAAPIAHYRQPITKLVRCYEALSQPLKVAALVAEVRTRSALARHWSPLDWEVFIEELRTYARELQEETPNSWTIQELLSMARDFEAMKNLME